MNKYNVGDVVKCYRKGKELRAPTPFDFTGVITSVNDAGYGEESRYEYEVTGAPILMTGFPCLIWESEIVKVVK